jgi:hypothetical protein
MGSLSLRITFMGLMTSISTNSFLDWRMKWRPCNVPDMLEKGSTLQAAALAAVATLDMLHHLKPLASELSRLLNSKGGSR